MRRAWTSPSVARCRGSLARAFDPRRPDPRSTSPRTAAALTLAAPPTTLGSHPRLHGVWGELLDDLCPRGAAAAAAAAAAALAGDGEEAGDAAGLGTRRPCPRPCPPRACVSRSLLLCPASFLLAAA